MRRGGRLTRVSQLPLVAEELAHCRTMEESVTSVGVSHQRVVASGVFVHEVGATQRTNGKC